MSEEHADGYRSLPARPGPHDGARLRWALQHVRPRQARESYKTLDPDLSDYIVSFAFGDIYSRTSLTQQEQTLVTISTLVALVTEPQLKLHINTGFNVGLTKGENRRRPDSLHPLRRVPPCAQRPHAL